MEEILHHLGCIKPPLKADILHINWLAGFLPSTVVRLKRPFSSSFLSKLRSEVAVSGVAVDHVACKLTSCVLVSTRNVSEFIIFSTQLDAEELRWWLYRLAQNHGFTTLLSFQAYSCFISSLITRLTSCVTPPYEEFPSKKLSCIHLQMVGKMWLPSTIPGYGFVPVFRINNRRITPAVGVEADWFAIKILSQ